MQPGLPAVTRALRCPAECRRTTGFRPFLGTTFTRRGPALMSTHCAGPFMPSRKGTMSKDVGLCACRILGQKIPEILTPGLRTKRCAPGPSTGWTGHTLDRLDRSYPAHACRTLALDQFEQLQAVHPAGH